MENNVQCLSDEELRAFRTGRVSDGELERRLSEHLGTCRTCESRLESLPDSEQLIVDLLRAADPFESLLDAESRPIARDSTPTHALVPQRQHDADKLKPEQLPHKIGKYFVLDWIARGGFGHVYKAKDPDDNRVVAIKVPRLLSVESTRQFVQESRTAGQLIHPSIVQVYDCQMQNDGTCYVVMQYIEGRSLREVLRSESVDQHRAARWIAEIASALHYAHSKNIYHRDVKPENILLDTHDRPYLADFGLAIRDEQRWDHEGEEAGTVAYMSPEQVRGKAHFIDGRTDIWSLGVVFYELLTRQKPFSARTRSALYKEIQEREPRAPRSINPNISPTYETICLRCLDKQVALRYPTAAELSKRLRARFAREKRIVVGSIVLLLLLGLASLALREWNRENPGEVRNWQRLALQGVNEPYDLLDRSPRPLVVPSATDQGLAPLSAVLDARTHSFSLQTAGYCLYSLGESPNARYLIQMGIQKASHDGAHGVFFGFRPLDSVDTEKRDLWICHAIILNCFTLEPSEQVTRLERHALTFQRLEQGFHLVEDLHEKAAVIPTGAASGTLEVRIKEQLVELIRWNGLEQKSLVTDVDHTVSSKWNCRGEFGLINLYGPVVFGNGQLIFD